MTIKVIIYMHYDITFPEVYNPGYIIHEMTDMEAGWLVFD